MSGCIQEQMYNQVCFPAKALSPPPLDRMGPVRELPLEMAGTQGPHFSSEYCLIYCNLQVT